MFPRKAFSQIQIGLRKSVDKLLLAQQVKNKYTILSDDDIGLGINSAIGLERAISRMEMDDSLTLGDVTNVQIYKATSLTANYTESQYIGTAKLTMGLPWKVNLTVGFSLETGQQFRKYSVSTDGSSTYQTVIKTAKGHVIVDYSVGESGVVTIISRQFIPNTIDF